MRRWRGNKHCPDYAAKMKADKDLRIHEGLRLFPYWDTATPPRITIGYGRNLDGKGISMEEAELLLAHDIDEAHQDLLAMPYWSKLSPTRKAALINMRFQLGGAGFRAFRRMNNALCAGEYARAAEEMLSSKWAAQTPNRAHQVAEMMRLG